MIVERKNFVKGVQQHIDHKNKQLKRWQLKYSMKIKELGRGKFELRILRGRLTSRKMTVDPHSMFKGVSGPKRAQRMGYEAAFTR